jgi:hypothetical protein
VLWGSARPTNQEHRAIPLELFIDLAYAFAATQVTAYMTHEHSLHGVIPGLLLLAAAVGEVGGLHLASLGHALDLATQTSRQTRPSHGWPDAEP